MTQPVNPTPPREPPSVWQWIIGIILCNVIIFSTAVLFIKYSPLKFGPIHGTQMIAEVQACNLNISACDSLSDFTPKTLPHYDNGPSEKPTKNWSYRLNYTPETALIGMQAIYIPKLSETARVTVNGQLIADMDDFFGNQSRQWSKPELYSIPPNLYRAQDNLIDIQISGYAGMGSELFQVYLGPAEILEPVSQRRFWLTRGASRLAFTLLILTTFVLIVLWGLRRRDPVYFWLIVCNMACIGIVTIYTFDVLPLSFPRRVAIIVASILMFFGGLLMFYSAFIKAPVPRLKRIFLLSAAFCGIGTVFTPVAYLPILAQIMSLIGYLIRYFVPAMVFAYRHFVPRSTLIIMFGAYCLIATILIHDSTFLFIDERVANTSLIPYFPIVYLVTVIWLIGSQFLTSLKTSETLARTLQQRVDEKTAELEKSYETLARTQRKQTLNQERQRIMMDLHDGIGGHLVNTIAYLENNQLKDPTLKAALEGALRDLSFMIDSLENNESVTTLLGMFRSRIEPLLESHGIVFKWEIGEEPNMTVKGPSQNLNLLRIIQEAVTNSIKHSGADEITVKTDDISVCVSDNGRGFDIAKLGRKSEKAGGVGFISMRKRAADIGAKLDIQSGDGGTALTLSWPGI